MAELDRGAFLRLGGAAALSAAGMGALGAAPASAQPPVPAAQGDDVALLSFGVVGERASLAGHRQALGLSGWTARERRLESVARAKRRLVMRLNALLGEDAVGSDDFAFVFGARATSSRRRALALASELEALLVGAHLNGAALAADAGTRLLLGRLLTFDAQQLAWLRAAAGRSGAPGLPRPVNIEEAGRRLDRYVTTPSFP